jgi:predicted metal-dependent peptidase
MSNEALEERLRMGKIGLMLRAPFFGNLASRLKIIQADDWCSTAATDGRNFYYNSEFINKLTNKNIEFLFGHEILHCALDHFGRCGSRNRKIANIAQDYAVNQILVDENVGEKITVIDLCIDEKYRGMPWEDIYDDLMNKIKKMDVTELLEQTLDDHINADRTDDKQIKDDDLQSLRDELKAAMIQAAGAAGDRTPKTISRMLDDLMNPKMNWRDLLRLNIQGLSHNNYSYTRPNKKGFGSGFVLPGLIREESVELCIALDMSGSISQADATAFMSEVVGIIEQYSEFIIDIWCFDDAIHNHQHINGDNITDLLFYDPQGGGGTNFDCNFEFMKETRNDPPKMFIMFTDGEPFGSWGDPNYCDTIFVIKGNEGRLSPFGQTLHYEEL